MQKIDAGFSLKAVMAITALSRRQLVYWRQTGLVVPSRQTSGGHWRYDFTDLIALRAAKRLLDSGVSLNRLRRNIDALRKFLPNARHPLTELSIVATGEVLLVFRAGSAFEAVSGQEWILPVAELERDIERLTGGADSPVQGELFATSGEAAGTAGGPPGGQRRGRRQAQGQP
ncbi:MAG TPA: MerR family transcriptional regulator [Acidiferrobacterales bacterium]